MCSPSFIKLEICMFHTSKGRPNESGTIESILDKAQLDVCWYKWG